MFFFYCSVYEHLSAVKMYNKKFHELCTTGKVSFIRHIIDKGVNHSLFICLQIKGTLLVKVSFFHAT